MKITLSLIWKFSLSLFGTDSNPNLRFTPILFWTVFFRTVHKLFQNVHFYPFLASRTFFRTASIQSIGNNHFYFLLTIFVFQTVHFLSFWAVHFNTGPSTIDFGPSSFSPPPQTVYFRLDPFNQFWKKIWDSPFKNSLRRVVQKSVLEETQRSQEDLKSHILDYSN